MEYQLLDHMSYKRFCGLANAINIPNRQSRKVHLGINAQTLEIRAIEVTCNNVGDAPILPELLAQIATPITSVTGDGAYDTKAFMLPLPQSEQRSSPLLTRMLAFGRSFRGSRNTAPAAALSTRPRWLAMLYWLARCHN
jgi:hypothetical protein